MEIELSQACPAFSLTTIQQDRWPWCARTRERSRLYVMRIWFFLETQLCYVNAVLL